jgi:nickel-type superoxide dismutase maturation protease
MSRHAGRGPLFRVAVSGDSMSPLLDDGDHLVCRRLRSGSAVSVGDVVVVEQPDRLGFLLVKRAVRRVPGGWWVEGDNAAASDDSRTFGAVPDDQVLALALARYSPRVRLL